MESIASSDKSLIGMNVVEQYQYTPLDSDYHEPRRIRILKLEPSLNAGAPLQFSMQPVELDAAEHTYDAISYTWGTPVFSKKLYSVGDSSFIPLTESLDTVLRKFRLPHMARSLWVDAVCINQNDDQDKAQQIPCMREIYQGARQVLVWLGGGEEEEKVVKFLCTVSRRADDWERLEWEVEDFAATSQPNLKSFFALPYFTRIWIIQEIVVNCDVTLFCGNSYISWTRFVIALDALEKKYATKPSGEAVLDIKCIPLRTINTLSSLWRLHAGAMMKRGQGWPSDEDSKFLALLDSFNKSQCTDPRDRLYALYHLATQGVGQTSSGSCSDSRKYAPYVCLRANLYKEPTIKMISRGKLSPKIMVDYTIPTEVIYEGYAISALRSPDILPILSAAAVRKGTSRLPKIQPLPSWVPDWTVAKEPNTPTSLLAIRGQERVNIVGDGKIIVYLDVYSFDGVSLPTIQRSFAFNNDSCCIDKGKHQAHCETSWLARESSSEARNEMGFDGLDLEESLLESCVGCLVASFRHLEPINRSHLEKFASLKKDVGVPGTTLSNMNKFVDAVLRFAQTYCSFSTEPRTSAISSDRLFLYHGIANTPVEKGDRIVIPAAWNSSMKNSGYHFCFRALVLRPVNGRSSFTIAGIAWVVPSTDPGDSNHASPDQGVKLQDCFEEQEISLELV